MTIITPEQFNFLATKDDLEKLHEDIKEEMRADKSEILTAIDGLAKAVQNAQAEQAADLGAHDRLQTTAENHEIRLKKLEATSI